MQTKVDDIRQRVATQLKKWKSGQPSDFDKGSENYKQIMYEIANKLSFSEQLAINQDLTK